MPQVRSSPRIQCEKSGLEQGLEPDCLPVSAPLRRREVAVVHAVDQLSAPEIGGPPVSHDDVVAAGLELVEDVVAIVAMTMAGMPSLFSNVRVAAGCWL